MSQATGRPGSEIVIYRTDDGRTRIDVRLEDETIWLSQAQMAELFQTTKQNISLHVGNIFKENELSADSVVKDYLTTAADGKSYGVRHYSLDAIIAVGYRVRSPRGAQFRRWATGVLREYLVKGFAMNDELLKNAGGGGYWRELLERIRDIRSSEKVFYRQLLDLYATSADYDPKAPESQAFFKTMQNKIHYAAHGHTAAEIVAARADAEQPFMGMTAFSGARPLKREIATAKNYLDQNELAQLNRMVSAFFDLAELRAMSHRQMCMGDWLAEMDDFAARYGRGALEGAGTVSHGAALEKARAEYEKYLERTRDEPSPAEADYLEGLRAAQRMLEDRRKARRRA
jgi:hypothetical protein